MLPFLCVESVQNHACMQVLVKTEYKIQVGQANNGLNSVRTHLITSHAFNQFKTNLNSQAAVTRQRTQIMKKHGYICCGASCYRRAYCALLSLGLPSGNSMGFKVLLWGDVKAFTVNTGAQQLGTAENAPCGSGRTCPSLTTSTSKITSRNTHRMVSWRRYGLYCMHVFLIAAVHVHRL